MNWRTSRKYWKTLGVYEKPTRGDGFTAISNELIYASGDLSDGAFRLLIVLHSFDYDAKGGGRKGRVWPSFRLLMELLHCSESTLTRRVKELESKGYILVTRHNRPVVEPGGNGGEKRHRSPTYILLSRVDAQGEKATKRARGNTKEDDEDNGDAIDWTWPTLDVTGM